MVETLNHDFGVAALKRLNHCAFGDGWHLDLIGADVRRGS